MEEDAAKGESNNDPQTHRSKVYLQLLKYKKAQEMKELEEINDSIDKYKSKSSKHQSVSSVDGKAEAEDHERDQSSSFFKRI